MNVRINCTCSANDKNNMENIISKSAYHIDETGVWKRMPFAFGIPMSIYFAILVRFAMPFTMSRLDLSTAIFTCLFIGLIVGLTSGLVFTAVMRSMAILTLNSVYDGKSKFLKSAPMDKEFSHRLPCNWIKSDNCSIAGVLYIGKKSIMFIPFKFNLSWHRESFEIAPLSNAKLSLVQPRLNLLKQILCKNPPRYIEIKWFGREACFLAPEAEQTIMKIKDIIRIKQLEGHEPAPVSLV